MTSAERARAKFKAWRENPLQFAHENFKFEPDRWQEDVLRNMGGGYLPSRRVMMKACTGPGKSALLAIIGWYRLACFAGKNKEHPKGAALSITKDNLSDNLWAELSKWQQRSEILSRAFTWTKSNIYANDHPETWFLSARSFAKDADQEAIGRALSGLHSRFPFILLDETGDMPIAVGRAAEQIFTGSPVDALIAGAGNPTAIDGLLYVVSTKLRHLWSITTITADPDDPNRTPRVSVEHAQQQIKEYGRDNPWVMATILGEFPPGGFDNLLTLAEVEAAMARFYREDNYRHAAKIIALDVARQGDDRSVLIKRQGLQSFEPRIFRNATTNDLAGWMAQEEDDWDSDGSIVDGTGGYGGGVIDQMRLMQRNVFDCQFASTPTNPKYRNKRAEIWFLMAEWIKSGGALPPNVQGLVEELTAAKYSFQGDKLLIEPKEEMKKRIGKSPDIADALAMTFAFAIQPKERHRKTKTFSQPKASDWNPYDYLS